jgi:hypothetical protein
MAGVVDATRFAREEAGAVTTGTYFAGRKGQQDATLACPSARECPPSGNVTKRQSMAYKRMNFRPVALLIAVVVALVAVGVGWGSSASSRHLTAPQRVDFKPGALAVGTRITCASHGYRIAIRVPRRGHLAAGSSDWGPHAADLRLTTRLNGAVHAVCSYH